MDFINFFLNLAVPPACLVMLAFAWPTLCFIRACERLYNTLYTMENMEDKVVIIITGASSGIGEQIAYEYAKRGASLLLVARREARLRGISEKARHFGAKQVLITAADVVKEDDCRRFVNEAITYYGRGKFHQCQQVWDWLPLPRMSLYSAAKAALVNFYETLRFELNEEIGLTIATHGWTGSEMSRGKFMLEDGGEMQWKEEREVQATPAGPVEEFAKLIVAGACRGDAYVKYPSWYDIFLVHKVFAPNVLTWTFRLLLTTGVTRSTSLTGIGRQTIESGSSRSRYTPRCPLQGSLFSPLLEARRSVPCCSTKLNNCLGPPLGNRVFYCVMFLCVTLNFSNIFNVEPNKQNLGFHFLLMTSKTGNLVVFSSLNNKLHVFRF
ncbi:hypothetical protein SLE2022_116340 [Rubroshorea leprosula]